MHHTTFAHRDTPGLRVNPNVLNQDVLTVNKAVHAFEIAFNGLDGEFYDRGSERLTFENYASYSIISVVDMSNQNAPNFRSEWYGDEIKTDILTLFVKL